MEKHFTKPLFDDATVLPIDNGLAPYFGDFQPEGTLSTFNGEDLNGEWALIIYTTRAADLKLL